MGLFGFGKKKEEKPACCCASPETAATQCCGEPVEGICCVKVLGAGCKSCHEQLVSAQTAVKKLGLPLEVEYVTDLEQVMKYGVMSMPAIVANGRVIAAGRLVMPDEAEQLLRGAGL